MLTAFITGILGSFHCVGMCGSIVLAVQSKNWQNGLLYHLGRCLTYAILGLMFGFFGKGLYVAGFQQNISIILGFLMILFVLLPNQNFPFLYQFYTKVKQYLQPFHIQNKSVSAFVLGFLNGLLPCGLVYVAIFAAISTADAYYGALYMFLFGLGTIPMLLLLSISQKMLSVKWRTQFVKIVPVFVVVVGILLILRGLNLDIPYLSPYIDEYSVSCCYTED
ncbi:MAG: sulfite exporter TauE/SafE family protein [Bacteroidetes bacterium]|nr:MAG: sulfite exporter TauE/SafE family protein [Bacteroidota bacterium]